MSTTKQRPLLTLLGLGLALMLGAVLSYMSARPALTVPSPQPAPPSASAQPAGTMPGTMPGSPEQGQPEGVTLLMQQLQANPKDMDALLNLAGHFLHLEDWPRAETFALRATLADTGNPRPLHLLGVIQHNQGRHAEAAHSLEQALSLAEDPSARYSLAILYAYFLKQPEQGATHLQKIIDTPETPADLRTKAQEELGKLPKK